MAQAAVRPLVLSEPINPQNYGEIWTQEASGNFFAAYLGYKERIVLGDSQGTVRHERASMGQLIPIYIRRCSEDMYKNRRPMNYMELLDAVKQTHR